MGKERVPFCTVDTSHYHRLLLPPTRQNKGALTLLAALGPRQVVGQHIRHRLVVSTSPDRRYFPLRQQKNLSRAEPTRDHQQVQQSCNAQYRRYLASTPLTLILHGCWVSSFPIFISSAACGLVGASRCFPGEARFLNISSMPLRESGCFLRGGLPVADSVVARRRVISCMPRVSGSPVDRYGHPRNHTERISL